MSFGEVEDFSHLVERVELGLAVGESLRGTNPHIREFTYDLFGAVVRPQAEAGKRILPFLETRGSDFQRAHEAAPSSPGCHAYRIAGIGARRKSRYDGGMEWCMAPGAVPQLIVAGVFLVLCAVGCVVGVFAKWPERAVYPFAFGLILFAGALLGSATSSLDPTAPVAAAVLIRC